MNRFFNYGLILSIAILLSGCFAEKSYMGKVNFVGVAAGPQPEKVDPNYVNVKSFPHVQVVYTPGISVEEQKANDTVKYVAGDALVKTYRGEPQMMVDYLNAYQGMQYKVLILDKNGVVAWSGKFGKSGVQDAQGVYDYGLTGEDRSSFDEAMEKYVLDGEESEDFDSDKKLEFPKGNKSSFMAGFSWSKRNPFLFTKLPDMKFQGVNGEVTLSQIMSNKKPTVLIFFMAKGAHERSLSDDISTAAYLMGRGGAAGVMPPDRIFQDIENVYFAK